MKLLKNILLTEDDVDDQEIFLMALKEIDPSIHCEIAINGFETIQKLTIASGLPDVLFLDLNMPVMNGFECLSQLKNNKRLSTLPVVIFTTSTNPVEVQATHQLGANVFFSKPNSFTELIEKLKRILSINFLDGNNSGSIIQYTI